MTMTRSFAVFAVLLGCLALSTVASAHCDTMKGPVVTAARGALDAGNVIVLHWVRREDEAAIRAAFQETMAARALGPAAKAVADRYFFETVVRIHRAGEGAPYTGLSEVDPEPIIAATDRALERNSAKQLERASHGNSRLSPHDLLSCVPCQNAVPLAERTVRVHRTPA
jgi:hypothetical protein